MVQRSLKVIDKAHRPLSGRATLEYLDESGQEAQVEVQIGTDGLLIYDDEDITNARLAVVMPQSAGLWISVASNLRNAEDIVCPAIEEEGPSWWHGLLGGHLQDHNRGAGVLIGVIDLGFEPDAGLSHVEILPALDSERPRSPERWSHGEAVCRILGDKLAPECCSAIAPGAGLVFANAVFTNATQRDKDFTFPLGEGDAADYLDPRLVASFIYDMAFNRKVDLISLSLGTFDLPSGAGAGLAEAIQAAVDAGVMVICAAGNQPVDGAAFPAKLETTLGVGAFGQGDWGPDRSLARWYAAADPHDGLGLLLGEDIFFWSQSAFGPGVDVVGPGVGILISRDGRAAFDLFGTSFAAPITAGLLAVELATDNHYLAMARDVHRSAYARRRTLDLARSTEMDAPFDLGVVSL